MRRESVRAAGADTVTLLMLKTTKREKETMQGEIVELTANSDRPSVPSPWKEVDGHCIASKGCCRNSYGLPRCVSVGKKAPSNVGGVCVHSFPDSFLIFFSPLLSSTPPPFFFFFFTLARVGMVTVL